jgi:branched-chain amino acid transport system permease protein
MELNMILPSTVNGLVLSAIYILVALGFGLQLSIMGIFNFAHGAIYMIGAYVTYGFSVALGLNQWFSLLLSIILVGASGLFVERFCFRPFKGKPTRMIVMAIALTLVLQTSVEVTLGGVTRAIPAFVPGIFRAGSISVDNERVLTFFIGAVLMAVLTYLIQRTKIGQQMLAVAQDAEGAALQGIDTHRIAATATVIACATAALSGSLMATIFSMDPFMGDNILLKAIQVVILGGIGSIGGIMAGGLIMGFLNAFLPVLTQAAIGDTITILIVVMILLIRPKGLFGYELF